MFGISSATGQPFSAGRIIHKFDILATVHPKTHALKYDNEHNL